MYNHKINKNAVKLQKRLFEVCRLFSELKKYVFSSKLQVGQTSVEEVSLNTLRALFVLSALFF